MWTYVIESGALIAPDGKQVARGYSGNGIAKNNPDFTHLQNHGPIPEGLYYIGKPFDSKHTGQYVLPLIPHAENQMFGRSAFEAHGDNIDPSKAGEASNGCIILTRMIRVLIGTSKDRTLKVIARENQITKS